ncbi:MAG: DEAD/DEAH box helicase [Actinomycetales bacterium]|nr:DEAD/DEAH box helicase [Actinomycetales bacterium]
MPTPNSKPLKPRQRKLQRDRAAQPSKKAGKSSSGAPAKPKGSAKQKTGVAKKTKKTAHSESKHTVSKPASDAPKRVRQPKSVERDQQRPQGSSAKSRRDNNTSDKGFGKQGKSVARTKSEESRNDRERRNSRDKYDQPKERTRKHSSASKTAQPRKAQDESPKKIGVTKPIIAKGSDFESGATFSEVGVHPKLVNILSRSGITEPFAIQTATLPDAISGIDVLGKAQTGSGKTLAFGLAMLTKLAGRKTKPRQPLGLILVPTRELAMQVNDAITPLAHGVDLDVRLIAGGMPYKKQIDALLGGVPILVSTPGRLSDLVDQGYADLSKVEIVVLDEADQMCDMGFMPQMVEILDLVPTKGQRLLFSATLDGDVNRLVKAYLKNPVLHETATATSNVATMEHHLLIVERNQKDEILASIAAREGKTIMFVRTQAAADRISNELAAVGIPVGALHGGKSQNLRTRTINEFREGVTDVLVATDVAARGIHVDGISLVVHVDPPGDPKDYLHRSGRTARAGDEGKVATLIGARQQRTVLSMMSKVGVTPKVHRVTTSSRELVAITGAGTPSGKPWKPPKTVQSRGGGRSGGRASGRAAGRSASGQNRRKPAAAKSSSRRDSR